MTASVRATVPVTEPALHPAGGAGVAVASPVRRRFRAADVARHLDMEVIGNVCVAISLSGYGSIVNGFLDDAAGSQVLLLVALEEGQTVALSALAHAVRGAAVSVGLRAVGQQAQQIEDAGARFMPSDCAQHAAELRTLLASARALLQRMGFA